MMKNTTKHITIKRKNILFRIWCRIANPILRRINRPSILDFDEVIKERRKNDKSNWRCF